MKRLVKIFSIAIAGATLLYSCNTEQITAVYSPVDGEGQYSFNASATANFEFSQDNPVMNIDVYRTTTDGAASVKITSKQLMSGVEANVLDVPSEVTFEDGSTMAVLSVTYNSNILPATNYNVTISLEEGATSPGGKGSISFVASLAYTWISLGTGQFYDNLAFGVDLDGDGMLSTPEEFQIQEVEILKADGYDRWRIVNPWANRDALAISWGSSAVLGSYSEVWEFYLLEDGVHVSWDGSMVPGILYESLGEQIIYQLPSDINAEAYGDMDDNIKFISSDIVQLNPAASIENTSSWFGQVSVYLGFPGVDLLNDLFGI